MSDTRSARSESKFLSARLKNCAAASMQLVGRPRNSSPIGRRVCSWRRRKRSPATGRPNTTGANAKRANATGTRCHSSETEFDGLTIHFIHVKSAHENTLPLIMTHGWPGSIIELLETIGPLTDPTAHGGSADDAFHLVLPSIPGYGFSDEPTELGWGPIRIGQAWHELMRRLGYTRYVAEGGDVGSQVTDAMGRLALDGLIGIHTNLLTPALGDPEALSASPPTEEERAALDQLDTFHATGTGYFVEQAVAKRVALSR